jgi:hypothetical protein
MLFIDESHSMSHPSNKAKHFLFTLAIALLAGKPLCPPSYAQAYPLKISDNKRYLVGQGGTPFFWSGEAAWSLIAQVSKEDAVLYLSDRAQKGFNVVMVNLIEHAFCTNPPSNYYGDRPFTGTAFITPNEAYFAHADYVINQAAQRGFVVLLFPLYLGYGCGNEGWCNDVKAASTPAMRAWGQYVGNRYKNFDNIVWCIGGDTDPTPVKDKVREFVKGILDNDTRHLITAHNDNTPAIYRWPGESWLNVNNAYAYDPPSLISQFQSAYQHSPVMPFFLIESTYENEHGATTQQLRAQAYWAVLSGGFGHIFGNCPIWHFGSSGDWCGSTNWKGQLNSSGSVSMMYVQSLFMSRDWYLLVPDFNHSVMPAGWEPGDATAARTSDGHTVIAYLPDRRQVTMDLSKISGMGARYWWYKPSDGSVSGGAVIPISGAHQFTPPANGDWVLVIDDSSLNLPAPGTQDFPPSSPTGLRIVK